MRDDAVFFVPVPLDEVFFAAVFVAVFFAVDRLPVDFVADVDFFVADVDFLAPVDLGVDLFVAGELFFVVRVDGFPDADDFPDVFLMGCTAAISPSSAAPAPSSPRDFFAARTLFSRAAIRSMTLPPPASPDSAGRTVSPAAFAAMSSSTASR